MLSYITTTEYENYFGVGTAPSDFDLKQSRAIALFQVLVNFPSKAEYDDLDTFYQDYVTYAICEQIKYYGEFDSAYEGIDNYAEDVTIGKYSESRPSDKSTSNSNLSNRISPNAWHYLLASGYAYAGGL